MREKWENQSSIESKMGKYEFFGHETKKMLANLLLELKPVLTDKEKIYDTILSDDASGRLVSLFLREIIDRQRKKLGKNGELRTNFIAAGHRFPMKSVEGFIVEHKKDFGRTLVATEYIASGISTGRLAEILDR